MCFYVDLAHSGLGGGGGEEPGTLFLQDAFSPRRVSRRGLQCAQGHALLRCWFPALDRAAVELVLVVRRRVLTSRLWRPCSPIRPALRTPASNLHNLDMGGRSCRWARVTWPITDSLLCFFLRQWLARAQRGFQTKSHRFHPSPPDRSPSLDRLSTLDSDRASSLQTPRSSRRERCCRTWCWGSSGLQAPNRCFQAQINLRPQLRALWRPSLLPRDSHLDQKFQQTWVRCGSPYHQTEPCLWNPNVPQMWTSSHFCGSSVDLLFQTKGNEMVSLSHSPWSTWWVPFPSSGVIFSVCLQTFWWEYFHKPGQQAWNTRKRYINLYSWDDDFKLSSL